MWLRAAADRDSVTEASGENDNDFDKVDDRVADGYSETLGLGDSVRCSAAVLVSGCVCVAEERGVLRE